MNEQIQGDQICKAAHQLWQRGMIAGDGGFLSVETHRRRYLVTPPGVRRSDLKPEDLFVVEIGGSGVHGGAGLPAELWRPHRIAYQSAIEGVWTDDENENIEIVTSDAVQATALVTPAAITALMLVRQGSKELKLHGVGALAVVDDLEGSDLRQALAKRRAVMIGTMGLLVVGKELASVLNLVEQVEQAAAVELNCELVDRVRGRAVERPEELDSAAQH